MSANNVRVRRTKVSTAKELATSSTASAPRSRSRAPKKAAPANLDDRIKHLECYIASASAANRSHHAMMADYVPAEEARTSGRSNRRRPMHKVQLERRRSAALFMQVIVLGLVIAAAVGWMNQRFHFWN